MEKREIKDKWEKLILKEFIEEFGVFGTIDLEYIGIEKIINFAIGYSNKNIKSVLEKIMSHIEDIYGSDKVVDGIPYRSVKNPAYCQALDDLRAFISNLISTYEEEWEARERLGEKPFDKKEKPKLKKGINYDDPEIWGEPERDLHS